MLNDKDINILSFIYNSKLHIHIDNLAQEFSLSSRSIRNYISKINQEFNKEYIKISRGVCSIENSDVVKQFLDSYYLSNYSCDIMKKYFLYSLAFKDIINITRISKQFEISRTSCKNYLQDVGEYLKEFTLDITYSNKGVSLAGLECNIRRLQLKLLLDFYYIANSNKKFIAKVLEKTFSKSYQSAVELFIRDIQQTFQCLFSDYSYKILKNYLLITISRIQKGHEITDVQNFNFLSTCKEFSIIKNKLSIISCSFNFSYSDSEVAYITDLILSFHYSNQSVINSDIWFEYDLFITKIIRLFSSKCKIDLTDDKDLYFGLINHIKPTMYRLYHNIPLEKVNYNDFIENISFEYKIVKEILNSLNFFVGKNIDNEIALIALYFKVAVEKYYSKNNVPINALIICTHGYGTSKLIAHELNQKYDIIIKDCLPRHCLGKYIEDGNLNNVNIIITTLPDNDFNVDIPVISIHPVLVEEDYKLLSKYLHHKKAPTISFSEIVEIIDNNCTIQNRDKLLTELKAKLLPVISECSAPNIKYLTKVLPISNIKIVSAFNSVNEALKFSGNILYENGFVAKSYINNLTMSFENYGDYMILGEGVAIPHCKNEENVYATGLCFVKLNTPIMFHDKAISILITFCSVDNNEHLDALVAISSLVKSKAFENDIINLNSVDLISQYLYTHLVY